MKALRGAGILGERYAIKRKIGAGGMADVYEVEHLELGSRFAAKVMRAPSGDERSVRRFWREARLLAGLHSDHIVTVFDVSSPRDERAFYVMELLHGCDLRRLMKDTPVLSLERAVKLVSDACAGLGVAHAAGLIHRDMKPENLFVTFRDCGEEVCKILDFGVAKVESGTSTRDGALIGTLRYMAPEQIEHPASVSVRADVYALGAILYECLARRPTHASESVERLLFQILNDPITPIRSRRPDVPEELERIVLRALERDPLRRFAGVEAMADALRPFVRAPGAIDPTSRVHFESWRLGMPSYRAKPTRRAAVTTILAGILATGALLAGGDSGAKPPGPSVRGVAVQPLTIGAPSATEPHSSGKLVTEPEGPPTEPRTKRRVPQAAAKKTFGSKADLARAPQREVEAQDTPAIGRIDPRNPYGG